MPDAIQSAPIAPPAIIALIGLGQMGLPMAARLILAGFQVHGADPSETARALFEQGGGKAFADAAQAAKGASAIITMLPNGKIVRDVLLGANGIAPRLPKGTLIIDMSSSAPTDTTSLAAELAPFGLPLLDAPVSGGVKRAIDGSLAIMAGGPEVEVERAGPILQAMGKSIFATGPTGSGHAMKALNNYVSAAGLIAASEALLVGRSFGLKPDTIVDVLNASTGRNNSTEVKMKPFVISEAFNSGFSFALMAKDLRIAADLATHLGLGIPQIAAVARLWEEAKGKLKPDADHTEIYRYLAEAFDNGPVQG
ncbi:NAD(P)-dependent oxidoreductase [Bosea psychrotolerans]|uniref:3-hydroxyisobutyrate dehydrogenase n=1 Tax=Bosea psychrotolerans TaxID=1871628 RepID=A0A2S4M897_9HYPH|nr:NAD(P)-dependent oxidoreductase [Bosea psychrotolerans]POR50970.1 3-hydroxyisobutyrate dehydrogenase [Bosea psychrotolerans]